MKWLTTPFLCLLVFGMAGCGHSGSSSDTSSSQTSSDSSAIQGQQTSTPTETNWPPTIGSDYVVSRLADTFYCATNADDIRAAADAQSKNDKDAVVAALAN